jgi:hypothetical protein
MKCRIHPNRDAIAVCQKYETGFAKSVVSVLISIIVVNVWIQRPTASLEPSASSGRCQKTAGKEKSIGRPEDREIRKSKNTGIGRWGNRSRTPLRGDLPTPAEAGFSKAGALQRAGTVTLFNTYGNKESNGLPLEPRGLCCHQVGTAFHDRYDLGLFLFEIFHTLHPRERE